MQQKCAPNRNSARAYPSPWYPRCSWNPTFALSSSLDSRLRRFRCRIETRFPCWVRDGADSVWRNSQIRSVKKKTRDLDAEKENRKTCARIRSEKRGRRRLVFIKFCPLFLKSGESSYPKLKKHDWSTTRLVKWILLSLKRMSLLNVTRLRCTA